MIEYFYADPPHVVSRDRMWCNEMDSIEEFCRGSGVDVGAGRRTMHPDVIRVDCNPDNEPHHVGDGIRLPMFADNELDFVMAVHTLEHVFDVHGALLEWLRVVKPGGHVALVLPDTRYTLAQNTDPTPHYHEWAPREFATQVLGWDDPLKPWYEARPRLNWRDLRAQVIVTADVVEFSEACPFWSFCVVLRKGAMEQAAQEQEQAVV